MATNKKISLGIMLLVLICIFAVAGQFAGGALYFKLVNIPLAHISIDALYQNWLTYGAINEIKPYLQAGTALAIVVTLIPLFLVITVAIATKNKEEIHGSARFANDMDLLKSGLFPIKKEFPTLLLGKMHKGRFKNKFIEAPGQSFVGVSASTGAGKGVSVVIPNLLNYSDSVVVTDIKLENFYKTAGFRASAGQTVLLFAPDGYAESEEDRAAGVLRSHRWNPLHYVRRDPEFRIGDILVIVNALYPLTGDGKSDIWPASSAKLFLALVLWSLDTEEQTGITPTIPYILSLQGVDGGFYNWIANEVTQSYLSDECVKELNAFLSYPDETKGSILANFNAPLSVYRDQIAAKAVSGNDFDFRDLRKKGISLYVGVQPPNKKRFEGMLNLFFEQLINENTRTIPELDQSLTHQCLLLLDEFPALGRVNQIKDSIGYTRQYNLRYMLVYQDKSQLQGHSLYGKEGAENIISNLAIEVVFPPKKVTQDVKELSDTLGTKTVDVESNSTSRGKNSSKGRNVTKQKRPLLYPHEIVELGYEKHKTVDMGLKALLLKRGQRPFIMDKIIYFEEEAMLKRVKYSKANVPTIPLLE